MRITRRVSFAAPLVIVAACGGSPSSSDKRTNPPAPTSGMSSEECKALVNGSTCEGDARCSIDGDGCGLVGYHCRDGAWLAEHVACNPPPPSVE